MESQQHLAGEHTFPPNPPLLYLRSLGRAILAALIIALIVIVTVLVQREANLSRWQFTDFSAGIMLTHHLRK